MSTPRYGYTNKGLKQLKRNWFLIGCLVPLVIGAIVYLGVSLADEDGQVRAENTEVCPEKIGQIEDGNGFSLYTFASCGSNLVVVPSAAGRYDLEGVASTIVDMMGVGSAEVIGGGRINIDMGNNPDIDAWVTALNATT